MNLQIPAAGSASRSGAGPAITVLFATRNRALALAPVLESFTRLNTPAGGWKLIVVDNGSTDGTPGLLRAYLQRLPLTMLTEARAGKKPGTQHRPAAPRRQSGRADR